jgi:outer membrane protein assembly factor BamB
VGAGYASPVIAAGRAYVHARMGEQETVSCFNLEDGKAIWQKNYPAAYQMNPAAIAHGKGPKSTPAIAQGRLYTFGISGILSCFDAASGELRWRQDFSQKFPQTSPLYGVSMSPLVTDDLVIVHAGGQNQGALMALASNNGETKWSWEGDAPGHASPIIVEIEGEEQIVTQTKKYCLGVAATTGHLLWSMPFSTDWDQNIVTPAVCEQNIIFSGLDKGTLAVRINKRGNQWAAEPAWHNPDMSMYMSSPVVQGDLIFGENAAILTTGEVLFMLTNEGRLLVAKPSAKAFERVAQYEVAKSATWAHPAIIGKNILVKDTSALALWSLE